MKAELISPDKPTPIVIKKTNDNDIFKQMVEWTDRISKKAYDLFTSRGFADGHDKEDWFAAERDLLQSVAIEISESNDDLIVRAEVPGFEANDLTIEISGNKLVITGSKEAEKESKDKAGNTITEHVATNVYKMVELPMPVSAEEAKSVVRNGILELTLPKSDKSWKSMATAA